MDVITDHKPNLYAISAPASQGGVPTIFVRATSPVKFSTKSIKGYVTDSFDRVKSPMVVFDETFDFIVRDDFVVVLNASNFERIVSTNEAARETAKIWATEFSQQIAVTAAGLAVLEDYLAGNSFARRKMQSIRSKSHLNGLSGTRIREALSKRGLDPADYLDGDALAVTKENAKLTLSLLNEDLFEGEFSGDEYAAARKSRL